MQPSLVLLLLEPLVDKVEEGVEHDHEEDQEVAEIFGLVDYHDKQKSLEKDA
jgi:hypothetical protein